MELLNRAGALFISSPNYIRKHPAFGSSASGSPLTSAPSSPMPASHRSRPRSTGHSSRSMAPFHNQALDPPTLIYTPTTSSLMAGFGAGVAGKNLEEGAGSRQCIDTSLRKLGTHVLREGGMPGENALRSLPTKGGLSLWTCLAAQSRYSLDPNTSLSTGYHSF